MIIMRNYELLEWNDDCEEAVFYEEIILPNDCREDKVITVHKAHFMAGLWSFVAIDRLEYRDYLDYYLDNYLEAGMWYYKKEVI